MNEETPDIGWVQRGPSVRTAYLPQIVRFAVPERSMLDTMLYECKCTPQEARRSAWCRRRTFTPPMLTVPPVAS